MQKEVVNLVLPYIILISYKINSTKSRVFLFSPVLCGVASHDVIRLFFSEVASSICCMLGLFIVTVSFQSIFEALPLLERRHSRNPRTFIGTRTR